MNYIIIIVSVLVCWRNICQTTVSRSTIKAKYISTSKATCKLVWLNKMLMNAELLIKNAAELRTKLELKVDNKRAINLANSKSIGRRSKYIEICHHILRDLVKKSEIKLTHVKLTKNIAANLTKFLSEAPFKMFCNMIRVINVV